MSSPHIPASTEAFTVTTFPGLDPDYVTAQPHDIERSDPRYWSLHLAVLPEQMEPLWQAVLATGCELLTGDRCGGDSWLAWCEFVGEDEVTVLHVYLGPCPMIAAERAALEVTRRVGDRAVYAVLTCAKDWSDSLVDLSQYCNDYPKEPSHA